MSCVIRKMRQTEYPMLENFLYDAVQQDEEHIQLPRSILKEPKPRLYLENFGNLNSDQCLCAEMRGQVVGAVWVRNVDDGYGSIDSDTPELAVSLQKEHRGQGIGTRLVWEMLTCLKMAGHERTSAFVNKSNYAVRMYKNLGFEVADENPREYIMVCQLQKRSHA